jgi:hypothetical protein
MSYFPYDGQNGIWSSIKSNEKEKEFEYNFLIICRYLNQVKNKRIILYQIVFILTVWTDYGKNVCNIRWTFAWNHLKGK